MAKQRNAHVGRTTADTERYLETTVRRKLGSTLGEDDAIDRADSTETSALSSQRESTGHPLRPVRQPSQLLVLAKDHWPVGVAVVLFAVATWMASQIFAMNREIGELRQQGVSAAEVASQIEKSHDEIEKRLRADIDRLERRLDALITAQSGSK